MKFREFPNLEIFSEVWSFPIDFLELYTSANLAFPKTQNFHKVPKLDDHRERVKIRYSVINCKFTLKCLIIQS